MMLFKLLKDLKIKMKIKAEKYCKKCGKLFIPCQWNQVFCGSKSNRTGCSWDNASIDRNRRRSETKEYKDYQKQYQKSWKKQQRVENTEYAQRQRVSKSQYAKSEKGKSVTKTWRQRNKNIIRELNRRRKMRNAQVFGSHTQEEWESKKSSFNYRCAECEVEEAGLSQIYPNAQFHKLTRDHIIPISKGGTDFISNIQPLCITCNASKHDKVDLNDLSISTAPIISLDSFENIREQLGKIVCTSLPADPLHPGHLSCLQKSTVYGDSLVVIINGDWFLKYKKGRSFMPLEMRCQVVAGLKGVDVVIPFEIENDMTVCEALKAIRPHVFTKGGDRADRESIPEWEVCEDYGIKIVTGVGDSKVHSSSNILEDWYQARISLFMKRS